MTKITKIINLTQHPATKDQLVAGVIDLPEKQRQELIRRLTFDELPNDGEVQQRAATIAGDLHEWLEDAGIENVDAAMIGGAPYLMCPLERYLIGVRIQPIYAYSERISFEEKQPDGSVRKVNVFRHAGFIRGCYNPHW